MSIKINTLSRYIKQSKVLSIKLIVLSTATEKKLILATTLKYCNWKKMPKVVIESCMDDGRAQAKIRTTKWIKGSRNTARFYSLALLKHRLDTPQVSTQIADELHSKPLRWEVHTYELYRTNLNLESTNIEDSKWRFFFIINTTVINSIALNCGGMVV